MAVTAANVKEIATEFAAVADSRVEIFIGQAERRTNRTNWGNKADDGVIYLTAHLLEMDSLQGSAPAGPLTSRRVHDVAWAYGASAYSDEVLASTAWGRRYLELVPLIFSRRCL